MYWNLWDLDVLEFILADCPDCVPVCFGGKLISLSCTSERNVQLFGVGRTDSSGDAGDGQAGHGILDQVRAACTEEGGGLGVLPGIVARVIDAADGVAAIVSLGAVVGEGRVPTLPWWRV